MMMSSSSSWFTSLKESAVAVASSAVKATEQVVSQVQTSVVQVPVVSFEGGPDMFQKLTLTSPELRAERERIDAEERRKESVRDKLSGLLPWETRDPERDILVEECKQVILALSSDPHTFTGPWEMPERTTATTSSSPGTTVHSNPASKSSRTSEESNKGNNDGEGEGNGSPPSAPTADGVVVAASKPTPKPTAEALERLRKLEPLPNLLGVDFDLDSHVGLIKRLLKLDPMLVKAQSNLSGGGDRERIFWHNYFFHCAFSRYEAGLSVDEVWSEVDVQQRNAADAAAVAAELQQRQQENSQAKTAIIQTVVQSVVGAVAGLHINSTNTMEDTTDKEYQDDLEQEIAFHDPSASHNRQELTGGATVAKDETQAALLRESQQQHKEEQSSTLLDTSIPPKSSSPTLSNDYDMVEETSSSNENNSKAVVDIDNNKKAITPATANDDDEDFGGDYEDPELDELEAEIARELED